MRCLRDGRRASLSSVAREASISKSALWSWETGVNLPCVPELERVLDALCAAPEERRRAFGLLDAPRGYRHACAVSEAAPNVPPILGALLRAVRVRRGLTQAAVAIAVGVDRATVAHWEEGYRRIGASQAARVCEVVGAQPLEAEALCEGRNALEPLERALFRPGMSHLDRMFDTAYWLQTSDDVAIRAVRFTTLLMALAADCAQGREHPATLALGLTLHAEELVRVGDYRSALTRLHEAERAVGARAVDKLASRVIPLTTEICVGRGGAGIRRALQLLDGHMEAITSRGVRSWSAANRALILAGLGDGRAALDGIERARDYARASGNLFEIWHRDGDRVRVLLALGRCSDAGAAFAARFRMDDVNCTIRELVLEADTLAACGDRVGAQRSLETARRLAAETDREHLLHAASPTSGGIRQRLRRRYAWPGEARAA